MDCIKTEKPAITAGEVLSSLLYEFADRPVLLLLSGGSSFSILEYVSSNSIDLRVTIGVLDERFDVDENINNFSQLEKLPFFDRAIEAGAIFIDTNVKGNKTLLEAADHYERALKEWRASNPDGVVIVTLGMGADGHTAGIMPKQLRVIDPSIWVVGYEFPKTVNSYNKRISVTQKFLETEVAAGVAYVAEGNKCEVLEKVLAGEGDSDFYPALLWHAIPRMTVVTLCEV